MRIKTKDKVKCPHCNKIFTFEAEAIINVNVYTSWETKMKQTNKGE